MKTNFTFRHAEPQEAARQYAQDRLDKLEKFYHRPQEANVVVTLEKRRYQVEVTISADGAVLTGKDESTNLMAALEQALSKIEIQSSRHRDRYKRRKGKESEVRAEPEPEPEPSPATEPQIISSNRFQPKPLSVEEAAILLKESSDEFMVFRNSRSESVNVLYRRKDGHFGLIEPEQS